MNHETGTRTILREAVAAIHSAFLAEADLPRVQAALERKDAEIRGNLRCWCQRCHNTYDAAHRKETRGRLKGGPRIW